MSRAVFMRNVLNKADGKMPILLALLKVAINKVSVWAANKTFFNVKNAWPPHGQVLYWRQKIKNS